MIIAYSIKNKFKPEQVTVETQQLLYDALWIDLLCPTREEEKYIEKILNLEIPTREEMQEIEVSSRLYKDNNALFMTLTMVAKSDTQDPKSDAVTLILAENRLITLRYIEPQSFALFISRLSSLAALAPQAPQLVLELLDSTIERLADILERIGHQVDAYSQTIFRPKVDNGATLNYKRLLQELGLNGDLNSKAQESLVTTNRLIAFLERSISMEQYSAMEARLEMLSKDIRSLSNHATFLSTKVSFLLDATLGMVNIEQNNIIKIFSIVAVILLPPTLIASIYGMNFKMMPELTWYWGYPFAIALMILSAWLSYKYFKKHRLL